MSLKAGRVGVNPADVDPIDGHINPLSLEGYTKEEADAKFETQTHASDTYETKEAATLLQPKTLAVPIEMLSGSKFTVESALQGLNSEKVFHECIEIASDSDLSKLKEGLNSVVFRAGVLLGYTMNVEDQITVSNNMRGVVVRNGITLVGFLSNYDGTDFYMLASAEILHIDVVRVIQTKRGGE